MRIGAEAVDEDPVDLDPVDGEALEVAERRVARSEVVDREVDAERLETRKGSPEVVDVLHEDALGQLEAEIAGAHPGALQDIGDQARRCPGASIWRTERLTAMDNVESDPDELEVPAIGQVLGTPARAPRRRSAR